MLRSLCALAGLAFALAFAGEARAQKKEELLKYLPENVNCVATVDVKGLMNSVRGKKEDWASKHESEYLAGAISIPPSVEYYFIGAELNSHGLSGSTVYGLATTKNKITMADLAKRDKADLEKIGDQEVVHSAQRGYFAEIAPGIVGGVAPPRRQDISKWLRYAKSTSKPAISDYLQKALKEDSNAQIRIAIDMHDLLDPKMIRVFLVASSTMKGDKRSIDFMEKVLNTLQGFRVTVNVGLETTVSVRLDFSGPVKGEAFYKPLFLELLDNMGARIPEFKDGNFDADGNSYVLDVTKVSDPSLRRIVSLIHLPQPNTEDDSTTDPKISAEKKELEATQKYYRSVNSLLAELKKGDAKSTDYPTSALWQETYAKKIDRLPILNVDLEMLKYGASCAEKLRALGAACRGVPIAVQNLNSYVQYNVYTQPASGYSNGWGGGYYQGRSTTVDSNILDVRSQQTQAINATALDRQKIWAVLDDDDAKIRKAMTQKYKVEFTPS